MEEMGTWQTCCGFQKEAFRNFSSTNYNHNPTMDPIFVQWIFYFSWVFHHYLFRSFIDFGWKHVLIYEVQESVLIIAAPTGHNLDSNYITLLLILN